MIFYLKFIKINLDLSNKALKLNQNILKNKSYYYINETFNKN